MDIQDSFVSNQGDLSCTEVERRIQNSKHPERGGGALRFFILNFGIFRGEYRPTRVMKRIV